MTLARLLRACHARRDRVYRVGSGHDWVVRKSGQGFERVLKALYDGSNRLHKALDSESGLLKISKLLKVCV